MKSFHEWFYNVILTSANSVPIQSLWVAFFVNPVDLNRAVQAGLYENGYGYFTLAPGAATNTAQGVIGALFANSVTIPGDGMLASKSGSDNSGGIKGNISSGRREMENLTISFLDTNMSFVDYNIRPWAIYASHKSLKDPSVKTTIVIIQFAKSGTGIPLMPRAIWTFHDACPVSIGSEEWNYGADNVISRQVEFAYNYYLLNADPIITTAQTIGSVLLGTKAKYTYQPKDVKPGGLRGHKNNNNVIVPATDILDPDKHSKGQIVTIPQDDYVSRGINIGLDILNGNSNIKIASDDVISRLKLEGENILRNINLPDDVPDHNKNNKQVGYVEKSPTEPDYITREAPERVQSGKVPVSGNAKENSKALSDTPIFFPGDGNEQQKKIIGRSVGSELDTANSQQIVNKQIKVNRTGNVGKNIPLQIVNISKEDVSKYKGVNNE